MNLSASSLFHYTSGGSNAINGIIREGFRIGYNREIHPTTLAHFSNSSDVGNQPFMPNVSMGGYAGMEYLHIPMVCFCDIRLSQIDNHIKTYGSQRPGESVKSTYGIGLSKNWGKSKGLNPIQYMVSGGPLTQKLANAKVSTSKALEQVIDGNRVEIYFPPIPMAEGYIISDNKENTFPLSYLYSKVLHSTYTTPDGQTIVVNFQDEKEWRYIPENAQIIHSSEWRNISSNRYYWDTVRINSERAIREASTYENLTFSAADITHIIVAKDEEILEVHQTLKKKYDTLDDQSMALLLSKVKSQQSLFSDI